jgi:hypothetical protein
MSFTAQRKLVRAMHEAVRNATRSRSVIDVQREVSQLRDRYPEANVPVETLTMKLARIGCAARVPLLLTTPRH